MVFGDSITKSMAAGMSITLAATVYLQCENKLIGAFLFSIGLLSVIMFQFKLYTGYTGIFADAWIMNKATQTEFHVNDFRICDYKFRAKELLKILFWNGVGTFVLGSLIGYLVPEVRQKAVILMQHKEEATWYAMLIKAVLCGVLMQIAFLSRNKVGNHLECVYIVAIICVMAFILGGFEHSIADMAYRFLSLRCTWQTTMLLSTAIIGNLIGGDITFRLADV